MKNEKLVRREKNEAVIAQAVKNGKMVYVAARAGSGKTTMLHQFFEEKKQEYLYLSVQQEDWLSELKGGIERYCRYIIVDDLNCLVINEDIELFVRLLHSGMGKIHFLLAGRMDIPAFLKMFYINNQLEVIDQRQMDFSFEEAEELLKIRKISCDRTDLQKILKKTDGWLSAVLFSAVRIERAGRLDQKVEEQITYDIYDYLDQVFWAICDPKIKKTLLFIGHLEKFSERQAEIICGKQNILETLNRMLQTGSYLKRDQGDVYCFVPWFSEYLKRQQKKLCDSEFLARRYANTALSFELEGDIPGALKYYQMAGDRQKITDLLINNSNSHAGDGYFYDLEKYYMELNEEEVEESPEMLAAMSMLHSLSMRVEESELFFQKLCNLEKRLSKNDPRKEIAKEKIAYLMISLPHYGSSSIIDKLKKLSVFPGNIQKASITGNMPSIMSGGLDFCEWSKRDRLLYTTLRVIINRVFGNYARGLPEISLGESLFEKNYDGNLTEPLMLINEGKNYGNGCDYQQLNFAANGLLGRMYICSGRLSTSKELMVQFRRLAVEKEKYQMIKNIDAYIVEQELYEENLSDVDLWFEDEAPNELEHFYILERYRYLLKCKVYLIKQMYLEGLSLLKQLEYYFTEYKRTYNLIQVYLLKGIYLYRMGNEEWKKEFETALKICEEYQFIRVVSDFGAAVYDLLKKSEDVVDGTYYKHLMTAVRKQAALYPRYLSAERKTDYGLTETEKQVLDLLAQGMSNAEIGNVLNISIATVKTHTGRIYGKLGVKNRMAAVKLIHND